MARSRVISSFVVTLGILAILVSFSMRNGAGVKAEGAPTDTTTIAYLPVATMVKQEAAVVHITNVGREVGAPAEKFSVIFADTRGVMLVPEQTCNITAGQTCSVQLLAKDCPMRGRRDQAGSCEFRAIIVGTPMGCVNPDQGNGQWLASIELLGTSGTSKYVTGDHDVLQLPTGVNCAPSPDAPEPPAVDSFVPSVDAPGPPPVDAFVPSVDAPPPPPPVDSFIPSVDSFVPPVDAPPPPVDAPPPV